MDVSAFPRGYLGFIGANSLGTGIKQAGDALVPVIDITKMIGLNVRGVQAVNLIATAGTTGVATVPANETWFLRVISATSTTGAGDTMINGHININFEGGSNTTINVSGGLSPGVSSGSSTVQFPDLLLPGGATIGFRASAVTGNPPVTVGLVYDILRS